jgi:hypothetical protein
MIYLTNITWTPDQLFFDQTAPELSQGFAFVENSIQVLLWIHPGFI